jgi:hypothetical protein
VDLKSKHICDITEYEGRCILGKLSLEVILVLLNWFIKSSGTAIHEKKVNSSTIARKANGSLRGCLEPQMHLNAAE